jgi:REP element-mobilizing transposase RayT
MKTRDYKELCKGNYYHVYNRGVNRERIFLDKQDYQAFLLRLRVCLGYKNRSSLRIKPFDMGLFSIVAYCLMDNHYHLLIRQNTDIGIGLLVNKLCTSYAVFFNKKYSRVGHLFQDIYKVKLIHDDYYLDQVSAYIHNNPENPLQWDFSSLKEYINKPYICDVKILLARFNNSLEEYLDYLKHFENSDSSFLQG